MSENIRCIREEEKAVIYEFSSTILATNQYAKLLNNTRTQSHEPERPGTCNTYPDTRSSNFQHTRTPPIRSFDNTSVSRT